MRSIGFILVTTVSGLAFASNPIVQQFQAPSGILEACLIQPTFAGDQRTNSDREKEAKLCAINFYDSKVALCPKTWSTSPGTIVHTLKETNMDPATYERTVCPLGKNRQVKKLAKFKQTMNAKGTSATSSSSSAVYYFLSRYLGTSVAVPVAVMRTMDKNQHFNRVSNVPKKPLSAMNGAGWNMLRQAEINPSLYPSPHELFTSDQKQIFGVLVDGKGERYREEINGIRSAWGIPQNNDFQKTMPFLALRSSKPLLAAMAEGRALADGRVKAATGTPEDLQMMFWMNEITEIVLMDYVMNQQDRIGNIDFVWAWYYLDDSGKVQSMPEESKLGRVSRGKIKLPGALAGKQAMLVQRTWIGDNDAGGRPQYSNFTRVTRMLESLRHMNPQLYRRFITLADELKPNGRLIEHLRRNFFLDEKQIQMITSNATNAAEVLKAQCRAGQIRFDLSMDLIKGTLNPSGREFNIQSFGGCE